MVWEAQSDFDEDDDDRPALIDRLLRDRVHRSLEHVFTILSLHLDREPLRLAFKALHQDDESLRGTALEYLENVLPDTLRRALGKHGGAGLAPSPHAPRARQEVVDDLLRSMDVASIKRAFRRARGSKPG